MAALAIPSPLPQFFDLDGSPLDSGSIFFGVSGQNPETNPVAVYWDAAATQPVGQPVRTLNGYTARSGSPAAVYANGDYSLSVKDRRGRLVVYCASAASLSNDIALQTQIDMIVNGLPSTVDVTKGAGMVGDNPALNYAALTLGAAVHDIALDANNISGVDPTGVASSVSALNTFFGLVGNGYTVRFRGTYKIDGQLVISGKNIVVDCRGATFNLSGDNAGFKVSGTVTDFTVLGGKYVGDGVNRDADSTKAQGAWIFGNGTGDSVQNVKVYGGYCTLTNLGWKFAAGITPFAKAYNCSIIGAMAFDIRGYVGGVGYGFQFSQADGSSISDCIADTCQRHGIYFAEGTNYKFSNVTVTRCGKNDGSIRGALCISRSAQVCGSGAVLQGNYDVGLEIDVDTQGTAPDNVLDGVDISGLAAYGNNYGDVRIGTTNPAADGVPKNVTISGRTRAASGFSAAPSVTINCGSRIKVAIDIDGSAAANTFRAVTLGGSGGAAYSADIEVTGSIDSAGYGIQVASALQTGAARFLLKPDRINCAVGDYDFLGGEDNTTNNDLRYFLRNGAKPRRTVTATGANQVIPCGGLGTITLAPAGASSYANFTGLTEGERLVVYTTGANATLLQSANLNLDGAANITLTSADCLELVYTNAVLRQVAKLSAN